jgi:hypothetical protein
VGRETANLNLNNEETSIRSFRTTVFAVMLSAYCFREQPALTARTRIYQLAVCQITTIQLLRLKTIGQILQRFKAKQAMISIRQPESIG